MPHARWTPAEYEIVDACSIPEAHQRMPHRTSAAIKAVRRDRHVGRPQVRWTKAEDRKLRKYGHEPIKKLMRRFKHRSKEGIEHRRRALIGTRAKRWKITEDTKLRVLYPTADRAVIEAALPNWKWSAIKYHAMIIGIRRETPVLPAANDLRDAVRKRAREDRVPLDRLGAEISCGAYFSQRHSKGCDFNKIAKAVEFFGGRLVIDWQDE
jgi:hypothetical protein